MKLPIDQIPIRIAEQKFPRALAYDGPDHKADYRQLWQDIQHAALQLRKRNAHHHLAWFPRNDYRTVVHFWATWLAKKVACPLSHRIPKSKVQEILQQLEAVLDNHPFDKQSPSESDLQEHAEQTYDLSQPATIILSSGTTGRPKAVVHSLSAHIANAIGATEKIPLSVGDRWLWALPTFHVGGLAVLFRCALSGATVCGTGQAKMKISESVVSSECSHVSVVPTQLQQLLEGNIEPQLKAVLLGGSAISRSLLSDAIGRSLPIHSTYGLSEMASQVCTTGELTKPQAEVGRTLPFRELKIGEHQEILVRGKTLCLGYWEEGRICDKTDEDGWFHTRDRGRLSEDGELTVLGRIDNMFISGGENIHPESIEQILLEMDGVHQAIVVPRSDAKFGMRPVAFVDAESHQPTTWIRLLERKLARFEIPIAFYSWPEDAMLGIKPDRVKLQRLAHAWQGEE